MIGLLLACNGPDTISPPVQEDPVPPATRPDSGEGEGEGEARLVDPTPGPQHAAFVQPGIDTAIPEDTGWQLGDDWVYLDTEWPWPLRRGWTVTRKAVASTDASGAFQHTNGSSCSLSELAGKPYFRLLATEEIAVNETSELTLIVCDGNWDKVTEQLRISLPATNVSMAMAAIVPAPSAFQQQDRGWAEREAIVYKQVHPTGEDEDEDEDDNSLDDHGDIFLWLRPAGLYGEGESGRPEDEGEVIYVGFGSRPHIAWWNEHLLISYEHAQVQGGKLVGQDGRVVIYPVHYWLGGWTLTVP